MDVKAVIKKHGFTIIEVAKQMGISRVSLSQSISGNPSSRTLRRIADVIGCEVAEFYKDVNEMNVIGFVEINGKIHKIENIEDLNTLYKANKES